MAAEADPGAKAVPMAGTVEADAPRFYESDRVPTRVELEAASKKMEVDAKRKTEMVISCDCN